MSGKERTVGRQPPWEQDGDPNAASFGTWLRRERELRQVSLGEIADVTKIGRVYLEALEEDRFDVLPAPVFAKGFLREYARYVGLDPDEVVNSYLTAQAELAPEEPEEVTVQPPRHGREWTSALVLALALVLLLAVVAFLAFRAERSRGDASSAPPPQVLAPSRPAVESLPPPVREEPENPIPLLITMDFTGDCWVEARVDGDRRIGELRVQGESLRIQAEEQVVLTLGNPTAVQVEVNGRPFPLPEVGEGEIAREVRIERGEVEGAADPG